ncbi:MAG TPA: helix-turn-helix domain-containing protein [Bacillota bacterium]|nr:helix-turn-helix domain-containing protein [Bacillota bacterium]
MLKRLKKIFPSLTVYAADKVLDRNNYQWFITAEGDIIGIDKQELTQKDHALLHTFLEPYNIQLPEPTNAEIQWKTWIDNNNIQEKSLNNYAYRFIYFYIQPNQITPQSFKEAINELFARPIPILWENEHSGIIIEEQSVLPEENISYDQIIDVLMSDLYVKIFFYIGPMMYRISEAKAGYRTLLQGAKTALTYSDKQVVTYVEAIPYILIEQTELSVRNDMIHTVLNGVKDDEDLLQSIATFIACNLNVSMAAKALYMHRNSLQYRLDKFMEKTGIDIRQFEQAVTVYLILLAKRSLKTNNV